MHNRKNRQVKMCQLFSIQILKCQCGSSDMTGQPTAGSHQKGTGQTKFPRHHDRAVLRHETLGSAKDFIRVHEYPGKSETVCERL